LRKSGEGEDFSGSGKLGVGKDGVRGGVKVKCDGTKVTGIPGPWSKGETR